MPILRNSQCLIASSQDITIILCDYYIQQVNYKHENVNYSFYLGKTVKESGTSFVPNTS